MLKQVHNVEMGKLRTQRILGELIAEGQRKGEIKKPADTLIQNSVMPGGNNGKNLSEFGLSGKKSSAFQQIASIPEDDFEEFIIFSSCYLTCLDL